MNCELVPIRKFRVGRKTVWWCDAVWKYEDSPKTIRSKTLICSQDDHVDSEDGYCEHILEVERIRAREWLLEYKEDFTTVDDFMERLSEVAQRELDRRIEGFRREFAHQMPGDQVRLCALLEMYFAMNEATDWVGQCDMDCISREPLRVAMEDPDSLMRDPLFHPLRRLLDSVRPEYMPHRLHKDPLVLPYDIEEWLSEE